MQITNKYHRVERCSGVDEATWLVWVATVDIIGQVEDHVSLTV